MVRSLKEDDPSRGRGVEQKLTVRPALRDVAEEGSRRAEASLAPSDATRALPPASAPSVAMAPTADSGRRAVEMGLRRPSGSSLEGINPPLVAGRSIEAGSPPEEDTPAAPVVEPVVAVAVDPPAPPPTPCPRLDSMGLMGPGVVSTSSSGGNGGTS